MIISKTIKRDGSASWRKYCAKCGLTWFAKNPKERCPDCANKKEIR